MGQSVNLHTNIKTPTYQIRQDKMFVPKLTIFFLLALPMINASCPQSVRVKYEPGHQGVHIPRYPAIMDAIIRVEMSIGMQLGLKEVVLLDMPSGGTVKRAAAPGGGADYAQLMQDIIGDTMIGKASSRLLEALQLLADANAIR